ncbi:response regulator [Paenibacillus sp. HB172176]|uniref:response regulator n=1 Tax=Paenibacillus sp. HB172176 TaxID=2493690 RepID=UPI00143C4D3F|nr:response regulator [Paenibacillus sp. HB172176]
MLKAIIVDDEDWAIKRLSRLLSKTSWIEICGVFQQPQEAYDYARENGVDAAFLDITMPQLSGMRLSAMLHELNDAMSIVFVTGYGEYAVQAFDRNALDYLMKPVEEARLEQTLLKIRKNHRMTEGTADISLFLFNGLRICSGGLNRVPLKLRGQKTEELLAFLVCKQAVSRDEIIETLWPTLTYEKALRNLNSSLYYIRKALGISKADSFIYTDRNEFRMEQSRFYCDLYAFEKLNKQAEADELTETGLIEQMAELYGGPLLYGRDYLWAMELARHYEQAYLRVLERAAHNSLTEAKHDAALLYFYKMIEMDKLREDVYEEIIRLCLCQGRRTEAIRCYQQLREALSSELGFAPAPEVTRLMSPLID